MDYGRRSPETTLLFCTLQAHWLGFVNDIEVGGGKLPAFVRDELEVYFRRGILAHSFLRVRCRDCGHSRVVVFSGQVDIRTVIGHTIMRDGDAKKGAWISYAQAGVGMLCTTLWSRLRRGKVPARGASAA